MVKIDYTLTIKQNLLFLKLVGLWPASGNDFYRLYTFVVTVFIMGLYNFFRVMNIFYVYTDLQVLTATIYLTVTDVTVLVKSCVFIRNVKTLERLILTLNCDLFRPKNQHQIELVYSGLKAWTVAYRLFWTLVFTCLFMWTVSPLTGPSRQLPVPAWYPYDTKISPNYEITYVCQVISIWILATANMNMDSLIAALMMYIGTQCDILCDDLKYLPKLVTKQGEDETEFNKKLVDCVIRHRTILSFAEDSNKSYNAIILAQFFTSSLAIALSMFQLTLVDPVSMESLPLLSYMFGMALQLFLYCWFGNEVEIKVR
ncbi:hypothetical protein Zmor_007629 [Zophobas morio]|uniref:7tm 6 domain containing protein n=2 Tax=Zophobas morio TaxID=2755281 RepID=A0AA38IVY2_9CUCU|nr:hypothetical protein Zmor_007629 [Zophobas morio]